MESAPPLTSRCTPSPRVTKLPKSASACRSGDRTTLTPKLPYTDRTRIPPPMVKNSRNASFCLAVHVGSGTSSGTGGVRASAAPVVVLTRLTLGMKGVNVPGENLQLRDGNLPMSGPPPMVSDCAVSYAARRLRRIAPHSHHVFGHPRETSAAPTRSRNDCGLLYRIPLVNLSSIQ